MSTNDAARCVNVMEAASFSSVARVNQQLMVTKGLVSRMNCYEPGQVTPMHKHPDEDEVLYIIEGHGVITFQDRVDLPVKAGDLVCLPADQFHQIVAAADKRMVLIYFMKPDYVSVRPNERGEDAAIGRLNGERS